MSYGYKTTLELEDAEYDVIAYSYSFEKDIDENGDVASPIMGGYLYLSLADVPKEDIIAWSLARNSYKGGTIKVTDVMEETVIAEEEVTFEFASCIGIKLAYGRDHTDYFTTLLTISARDIKVGRGDNWINKEW